MKLLRFNENKNIENFRDYFIDMIDDGFKFSTIKTYTDEYKLIEYETPSNAFYLKYKIQLGKIINKRKHLPEDSNNQLAQDFIDNINRCSLGEGLEIIFYSVEQYFNNGIYKYDFKCSFIEEIN
jgi:hypothetical protein